MAGSPLAPCPAAIPGALEAQKVEAGRWQLRSFHCGEAPQEPESGEAEVCVAGSAPVGGSAGPGQRAGSGGAAFPRARSPLQARGARSDAGAGLQLRCPGAAGIRRELGAGGGGGGRRCLRFHSHAPCGAGTAAPRPRAPRERSPLPWARAAVPPAPPRHDARRTLVAPEHFELLPPRSVGLIYPFGGYFRQAASQAGRAAGGRARGRGGMREQGSGAGRD